MKKYFVSMLALLLALCCVAGALGEENVRVITTRLIFDGQIYDNTTRVTWEEEYPIPDGGIEWDENGESLYPAGFSDIDLDDVPDNNRFESKYVKNQIMLMADETSNFYDIKKMAAKYDCIIVGFLTPTGDYVIQTKTNKTFDQLGALCAQMSREKGVVENTVSIRFVFPETSDAYPDDPWGGSSWNETNPEGNNWGVEDIKAPTAWNYSQLMNPMTVGVIDGFIDTNHIDIAGSNIGNMDSWKFTIDTLWGLFLGKLAELGGKDKNAFLSEIQHGTHVSGIIAAEHNNKEGISGVFPKGIISGISTAFNLHDHDQAIDDISEIYSGYGDPFMHKFYFLLLRKNNVKVINMSLGINWWKNFKNEWETLKNNKDIFNESYSAWIDHYTRELGYGLFFDRLEKLQYDFILVQSAGNDSIDARMNWWPMWVNRNYLKQRTIIVGAYNQRRVMCEYSNYGSSVDIVAPGEDIYSCITTGSGLNESSYLLMSGTSQAAPHVAGTAAMIWSLAPDKFTGPQVKSILLDNANHRDAITSGHDDDTVNGQPRRYPLLDAGAAVEAAVKLLDSNKPTPSPSAPPDPKVLKCRAHVYKSDIGDGVIWLKLENTIGDVKAFDIQLTKGGKTLLDTKAEINNLNTVWIRFSNDTSFSGIFHEGMDTFMYQFQADDNEIDGATLVVYGEDAYGQKINKQLLIHYPTGFEGYLESPVAQDDMKCHARIDTEYNRLRLTLQNVKGNVTQFDIEIENDHYFLFNTSMDIDLLGNYSYGFSSDGRYVGLFTEGCDSFWLDLDSDDPSISIAGATLKILAQDSSGQILDGKVKITNPSSFDVDIYTENPIL